MKNTFNRFKFLIVSASVLIFSGCANVNNMPIQEDGKQIDTSEESVLVGRLSIKNINAPGYQPELLAIITKKGEEYFSHVRPVLLASKGEEGKDYFFSMKAKPGNMELKHIRFLSNGFLIHGMGDLIINQPVDVPEDQVVYIGNIGAVIVPREEGQMRAGPVIPLIDQAVTGFSDGTYNVEISDQYEDDVRLLLEKYPYLKDKKIGKQILEPWKAQVVVKQ